MNTMFERLINSYQHNADNAVKWSIIAVNDTARMKDKLASLDSICNAYTHLGKARAIATTLAHEFKAHEYLQALAYTQVTVDNASEFIRNYIQSNLKAGE